MKAELLQGNIEGALDYFSPLSTDEYREIFTVLSNDLANIAAGMEDIELVYIKKNLAKYRIKKDETIDGVTHRITYYIYFVRDVFGIWHIDSF